MKSHNGYNPKIVTAFFKEYGVPEPVFEFCFDSERKWRFDLAWPDQLIGRNTQTHAHLQFSLLYIEVQGGLFSGGRHTRGAALLREYEKINRASVLGWRGLFVTPQQLLTKQTVNMVRECLGLCPVPDKHIGQASSL
jgi:hypothetical protein